MQQMDFSLMGRYRRFGTITALSVCVVFFLIQLDQRDRDAGWEPCYLSRDLRLSVDTVHSQVENKK